MYSVIFGLVMQLEDRYRVLPNFILTYSVVSKYVNNDVCNTHKRFRAWRMTALEITLRIYRVHTDDPRLSSCPAVKPPRKKGENSLSGRWGVASDRVVLEYSRRLYTKYPKTQANRARFFTLNDQSKTCRLLSIGPNILEVTLHSTSIGQESRAKHAVLVMLFWSCHVLGGAEDELSTNKDESDDSAWDA